MSSVPESTRPHLINGKTTLVGLIGWPVGHSVSPAMHNAAFSTLGLNWCYVPLPVATEPSTCVGDAVAGLVALGFAGANVTVPHKQAVMPHLDELTPAARAIGAVNTIIVGPERTLLGDNTDAPGFIADLRDHAVDPAVDHALILGAGGSARAVVYGLADAGCRRVTLANRTQARAAALAQAMAAQFPAVKFEVCGLPDDLGDAGQQADLIVNCTSLGMSPDVEEMPWDASLPFRHGQTVYDLIYNPRVTRLLTKAEADGARAIGGIGMLIWQGAIAFERWTGQQPPIEVMRRAGGLL